VGTILLKQVVRLGLVVIQINRFTREGIQCSVSQGLRTGILTVAEADGIMRANRGEGFRSNSSGGSYGNPNADYGQRNQRNDPTRVNQLFSSILKKIWLKLEKN
jgi:hypothetical protein